MATTKEIGIIIKILDYQDNDQIITALTKDEVISFIAQGVRKINSKNRIALQHGNIVELNLFRAKLKNKLSKLKKAVIIKQMPIKKISSTFYLFELIKSLQSLNKPSERLFRAYVESFNGWGTTYDANITTYVTLRILDSIGEYPIFDRCVECKRMDNIMGFEFYKGGFTCNLHTKMKQDLDVLRALKAIDRSWQEYKHIMPSINNIVYKMLRRALFEANYYIA